jgi:hypothetical protein
MAIDYSCDGFYVLEVEMENERVVAERCGLSWMPTGLDWDYWQDSAPPVAVKIIAKIDPVALTFTLTDKLIP